MKLYCIFVYYIIQIRIVIHNTYNTHVYRSLCFGQGQRRGWTNGFRYNFLSSPFNMDPSAAANVNPGEIMAQVRQEVQEAQLQELVQTLSEKCFEKCVKPSKSLSSGEQACISKVRFIRFTHYIFIYTFLTCIFRTVHRAIFGSYGRHLSSHRT